MCGDPPSPGQGRVVTLALAGGTWVGCVRADDVPLIAAAAAAFHSFGGTWGVRKLGECRADLQVDGLCTVR
jgi:hypothetical protein